MTCSIGAMPLLLAGCSSNPVYTLAPVPAGPMALMCAAHTLDAAGYDVRVTPRDSMRVEAERREGAYGTEVRREFIHVALVPGSPSRLQASARAIALHAAFAPSRPNEALPQRAVAAPPQERTVADARQVLAQCGRS